MSKNVLCVCCILIFFLFCAWIINKIFFSKINIYGGGRVINPTIHMPGSCYYVCALNLLLDSDYIRKEIKKDKRDLLSRVVHFGDFRQFQTVESGGNVTQVLGDMLDKYDFKHVSLFDGSFIIHSNAASTQSAFNKALKKIHDLAEVVFIHSTEFEQKYIQINDYITDGMNMWCLTGICYSVYEQHLTEGESDPDVKEIKYPHNHVVYVHYNEYIDKWCLLTDGVQFILQSPIIDESIVYFTVPVDNENTRYGFHACALKCFSPRILRYEKKHSNYTVKKMELRDVIDVYRPWDDDEYNHQIGVFISGRNPDVIEDILNRDDKIPIPLRNNKNITNNDIEKLLKI